MSVASFDRGAKRGEELIGQSGVDLTDDEMLDGDFCEGVDSVAFKCVSCGWWCGIGEVTDKECGQELVCQDCA